MSFTDKVIIVTGASSGIGADAARHLASLGGKVAIVGRNSERLNKVADEIKNAGSPPPLAIVADVTTDAQRIIDETIAHFGKLNILINNAGILSSNSIENIDLADFDRVMNTNVRSVIHLTKLAVSHLEKTQGNILNVSSAAGLRARGDFLGYCISKAAINQMTKSAALALASKKIRVNAICPVAIRTPIFQAAGFIGTSDQEQQFFDSFKEIYPLGRIGEVTDTSYAIEFLVKDSASFLTGLLLPVDGGALVAGK